MLIFVDCPHNLYHKNMWQHQLVVRARDGVSTFAETHLSRPEINIPQTMPRVMDVSDFLVTHPSVRWEEGHLLCKKTCMTYLQGCFSEQVEDRTEVKLAEQDSSEKQQSTEQIDKWFTDHTLPANLLLSILVSSYATVCSLYH